MHLVEKLARPNARSSPPPARPPRLFAPVVLGVPPLALHRTLGFRIIGPAERREKARVSRCTRQPRMLAAGIDPRHRRPQSPLSSRTRNLGRGTHASFLLLSCPAPPRALSLGPTADLGGLLSLSLSLRPSRRAGDRDRDLSRSFPDLFLGGVSGESDRLSRSPWREDEDGSRGSLPLARRRSALS